LGRYKTVSRRNEEIMQHSFRVSSRRLLLPSLVALALLPAARADTVSTFDVSGNAVNVSTGSLDSCGAGASCPFSGTLTVDVTTGKVDGADITLPGLSAFETVVLSTSAFPSDWKISATNSSADVLTLDFNTDKKPGSLVGFDGASISSLGVTDAAGGHLYGSLSGNITPGVTTPTPEPSSLGSLAAALLTASGIFAWRKREMRGKSK
jgi:hypothetical protein